MITVEVLKGFEKPTSRTVNDKIRWSQEVYVHLGGAFPVKAVIPLENETFAYPVGKYELAPESFRVGKYDSLEINPFNIKLISQSQAEVKRAS